MRTRRTVAALQARIDQLEAQIATDRLEPRTSRRGMLRLAGAAAVGGLTATVAADPVAATTGDPLLVGMENNAASSPTTLLASLDVLDDPFGFAVSEPGFLPEHLDIGERPAVVGYARGAAFNNGLAGYNQANLGVGVLAVDKSALLGTALKCVSGNVAISAASTGHAVVAVSAQGVGGIFQGAAGALNIQLGLSAPPPPTRATPYAARTLDADENNDVWVCYQDGTPGKWRKLAGPATAGAFHPITPTRVYDSRAAAPTPGLLAAGNNRLVSVADGRDSNGAVTIANLVPAGATAVAANITVTGTTGNGGYLAVNPGGVTTASASTINWFGAGQNLANGVTLTLNATRELTVVCGAGGGSTHFIIDIAGYYL